MSLALVFSRAISGMQAPLVEVEAHLSNGLPAFNIVGLPSLEIKESRDRIRAAIVQSGFEFPAKKITINLAPADLPKDSGRFDLPIAIGILAASAQLDCDTLQEYEFAGELSLSGQLRPVRGSLLMADQALRDHRKFIAPQGNEAELGLLQSPEVLIAPTLTGVAAHLNRVEQLPHCTKAAPLCVTDAPDMRDIKGQSGARFTLELAAAGGHSLLMVGPPGSGKSMLAARLPGILPRPTVSELREITGLYSLLGLSAPTARPYRTPHHTASAVALVGGGCELQNKVRQLRIN